MNPDRWEQINRLWDAALEVPEEDRAAFLERNCQGDPELRREVESLLEYDGHAKQFIDRPALQMTAEKLANEPPSLVGRKLGPYQILALLGAGGMGEVYTARDTRLNRTVAIKVLPRHLSERPDRRQRFEREARAVASLNHPHICALYDVGKEGETDFLVMEYLEGETLSERLRRGPLETEDVLRYSLEIAGALDKAHRKGVIHRDLKPGNIMLTETGARLLDFGLAKRQVLTPLTQASSSPTHSTKEGRTATQSKSLTEAGMILGTLEYMAPEQLEGKEADARTDIFALGVVIYEMATGRKAFEGDSKASLIAKILTFQPPAIQTIQPVSPPELDALVQKCLAKRPEERWQSAAELTSKLQEIAESNLDALRAQKRGKERSAEGKEIESGTTPAVPVAIPEQRKFLSRLIRFRAWKLGLIGLLLAIITGSLVLWRIRQQPEKPKEKANEILFRPLTSYSWENPLDSAAISQDGKYLAFCSKGKLYLQIIRSGEKRSLPVSFYPFGVSWFPDGTKLLISHAEREWFRVKGEPLGRLECSVWSLSVLGGTPKKIVDHAGGAAASPDGSLVAFERFDPQRQTVDIWLIDANGEGSRRIRESSSPDPMGPPAWSSNGQRLYYIVGRNDTGRAIESCDLRGENVTTLFSSEEPSLSLCSASEGRILFSKAGGGGELWEIMVDTTTGQPLSQARRLTQLTGFQTVRAGGLSITADGRQLVLLKMNLQGDVFVGEVGNRDKALKMPRRLTQDETDDGVWDWTADSRAVLFVSYRNGNGDILKQYLSQTEAETVVATPEDEWHPNLSPDGAFILYLVSEKRGALATRLMRVPVEGGSPELVLRGDKIKNFSCAREAKLCVIDEEVEGKQVLITFDALKGRGERLPISDYLDSGRGILSPQGRLIEKMKSGPDGLYIRARSLPTGSVEEVTIRDLIGDYHFHGWALDGKGIYIWERDWSTFTSVYAGLDGRSQLFWKRGLNPGWWIDYPIPSPNGKYIASTIVTAESNAWLLENF